MMSRYPTAIILAGGVGTRMQSLGQLMPKCLVPVFDQPLLIRQIEQCCVAGVGHVIVSIARAFEPSVRALLAVYRPPTGVTIECIAESTPLGPVCGLLALTAAIGEKAVLVVLGDEYYEDSLVFEPFSSDGDPVDVILGVVLHADPDEILCNVVLDAAGRIVSVREKPSREELIGRTAWCGCVGFGAGVLQRAPVDFAKGCVHLGDLIERFVSNGASSAAFVVHQRSINVNTAEAALAASLIEAKKRHAGLTGSLAPVGHEIDEVVRKLVGVQQLSSPWTQVRTGAMSTGEGQWSPS